MKKLFLLSALVLSSLSQTAFAKNPLGDVCWAERDRYAVFNGQTLFNCAVLGETKLTVGQIYDLGYRVVTASTAQLNNGVLGITLIIEKRKLP